MKEALRQYYEDVTGTELKSWAPNYEKGSRKAAAAASGFRRSGLSLTLRRCHYPEHRVPGRDRLELRHLRLRVHPEVR